MRMIPSHLLLFAALGAAASAVSAGAEPVSTQTSFVSSSGNGAVVVVPEAPAGGSQSVTVQVETKSPKAAEKAVKAALLVRNHAGGDFKAQVNARLSGLANALSAELSKRDSPS